MSSAYGALPQGGASRLHPVSMPVMHTRAAVVEARQPLSGSDADVRMGGSAFEQGLLH